MMRPMWSRKQLLEREELRDASSFFIQTLLPFHAYCFDNGPWRHMWTRYGYDPMKEPEARFLQILALRLNPQALQAFIERSLLL